MKLEPATPRLQPSALEKELSLSSWCIASLYIYHFSTVVDFSSLQIVELTSPSCNRCKPKSCSEEMLHAAIYLKFLSQRRCNTRCKRLKIASFNTSLTLSSLNDQIHICHSETSYPMIPKRCDFYP